MLVLLETNTELADKRWIFCFCIKKGWCAKHRPLFEYSAESVLVLSGMVSEDTALIQVNSNHAIFILGADTVHYRCS